MHQRDYSRYAFVVLVCLSLLQLVNWLPLSGHAPVASAYAFVVGSDPVDGSTIGTPPTLVRMYFAAPISADSQAHVYAFQTGGSPDGQLVNAGPSVVNASNLRELDTPLLPASRLPQGSYEVRWTALSLTDGRTTSGLIGFNLGQSSSGISGTPLLGPSTSNYLPQFNFQGVLAVAWDWLTLLALCFWLGLLLLEYVLLPRSIAPPLLAQLRKHSAPLQTLCLGTLLVGEAIALVLRSTIFSQTQGSSGFGLDMLNHLLLNTNYGHLWLARIVLLLLALFFLWRKGYRQQEKKTATSTNNSQATKRFSQLRQQARPSSSSEPDLHATPPPRSLPRVTGAVAAVSARSNTAPLSRLSGKLELSEPAITPPSTRESLGWLVLGGLLLLTVSLSHEITQLTPLPLCAMVFTWLSLAAQSVWFGSLAYLGLVLLPMLLTTDPDHYTETLVGILKRTTPLILSAIGVLLISELFLGESTIQAPEQLLNDPYGRALLVRAVFHVLMIFFTCYALFAVLPRLQRQAVLLPVVDAEMPARRARKSALDKTTQLLKRTIHTLCALAAVTLLCLSLMNFFAPPIVFPDVNYAAQVAGENNNADTTQTQAQQVGDLKGVLKLSPAHVGAANTLTLTLTNAQGQAINDADVKLHVNMEIMDMGEGSASLKGGSSVYTTTFEANQVFTMAGPWLLKAEINRPGQATVTMTFQVVVAG